MIKHASTLLFSTALLALTACGGEKNASSVNNENTSHPEFSWAKVAVSNNYSPSGDTTNLTPTFSWKAVSGATEYNFGHELTSGKEWKEYTVPAASAGCATGSTCSYTPANHIFNEGEQVVWWVRGKVASQWKSWSSPYVFNLVNSVGGGTNSTPTPTLPINGKVVTDDSPFFTFKPMKNAKSNVLGLEKTDGTGWQAFTFNGQDNCPSTTDCPATDFRPSQNFANGDYTWWIRTQLNNGTWTNWSNGADFTIKKPNNSAVKYTGLLPVGNYNSTNPIFEWNPVGTSSSSILGTTKEYQLGLDLPNGEWLEYSVLRGNGSGNCKRTRPSSLYPLTCTTQVTDANLKAGNQITWYLRAKVNGEWKRWSDGTTFTINNTIIKPTAPTNLKASLDVNSYSVILRWDASYRKYEIYRDGQLIGTSEEIFRGPPGEFYQDRTIESGKTYSYTVISINRTGDKSLMSKPLVITIP